MTDIQTAAQPLNELLNVAHDRPFSLLFANYSYLVGVAGAIFVIWALRFLITRRLSLSEQFLALPLAVSLFIPGMVNVLLELHQPGRILHGYLYGWDYLHTAFIKWAIFLLPSLLALIWWMMMQSVRDGLRQYWSSVPAPLRPVLELVTLGSRHYDLLHQTVGIILLCLGIVLGLFATAYSGLFLMSEHGIPFWNTPLVPLMFSLTAFGAAAGCYVALTPLLRLGTDLQPGEGCEHRWVMLAVALLGGLLWIAWPWWLGHFGTVADQRALALLHGPYSGSIMNQWILPGILLPLVLLLLAGSLRWARVLAGLGLLYGAYTFRVIVVIGGQALQRSGTGYLAYSPEHAVIIDSILNLCFLLGWVGLLLWLLPMASATDKNPEPGEPS